ncbi:MAG: BACON domain-containing protein [Bacteroidales bacterium]|nr:BACON domain-containing protein [Bacteroidales bacterium]
MKKVFFAVAIAATMLLASCQKEREVAPGGSKLLTIHAQVEEAVEVDTKTTLSDRTILWGTNEYATLYYNDGTPHFAKSLESSASRGNGKASTSFDFSVTPASASSYVLGGVYPASAVTGEASENCEVTLPALQNATAGAYDPAAFILVMKSETVSAIPATITGAYRRAVALNKMTLTGTKEAVTKVEITATGKALAGARSVNMVSSRSLAVTAGSETVTVSYASALPAGNIDVWFTSWDAAIAAGEKMSITAYTASGTYTKTVTAKTGGINFKEGGLNSLTVDFSGVALQGFKVKDFARVYATFLDVWMSNTAKDLTVGNFTINGHYVPANTTISLGTTTYTKTAAYGIALKVLQGLADGSLTMDSAIPAAPGNYTWGADPYNEGKSNGGEFGNAVVTLDFLRNFASRELTYAGNNSRWSNFCTYTDANGTVSTMGTPQVTGYTGVCCLERNFLMMARFFRYLLDNNITSNILTACATMEVSSDLYESKGISVSPASLSFSNTASTATVGVTSPVNWTATSSDSWLSVSPASGNGSATVTVSVTANTGSTSRSGKLTFTSAKGDSVELAVEQTASGSVTLKDFATAFAGVLDVWNSKTASSLAVGQEVITGHYVPSNTTITVGGKTYTKAQMYDIAVQGLMSFASGGSLTAAIPTPRAYTWSTNPYSEPTSLSVSGSACTWDFIKNVTSRQQTYAGNNGVFANFCTYEGGQVSGYSGYCCLERSFLISARFYKYLVEKNITTNIVSAVGSTKFDIDLFNYTEPTTDYPSPWTQSGIHLEQKPGYLGQINGYNCGPHSLMQCIYKITKVDMAEKTLASWAGTTTSGTGHDGLATALKRFNSEKGYGLTMTWYNYSDCTRKQIGQWMANPKTAIFFHLYYRLSAGHYELPYKITDGASSLEIANSLGNYYNGSNSSGGYYGYIETRTWANQESYIKGISQKSVCVIRNPN